MKKLMIKVLGILVAVILLLLLMWWFISGNKIKEYRDENGSIMQGSLSEKFEKEINGARNGFFINSKNVENPVLLLVSSGPGTDDYFLTERFGDMHIDDMFTVVYWDYRGMGIVYDSTIDPKTITTDVLVEDAKAVTEYLKERFHQDKIYLMGFSGGTHIATRVAKQYPDDYYAYIGMAQIVTDSSNRDQLMYDFMKKVFEERGDKRRLKKLDSMVYYDEAGIHNKSWGSYIMLLHEAGGGTTYNETEFWGVDMPIVLSRCYTIQEKINYIRGMKMYRKTALADEMDDYDYRKTLNEFDLPVYFLSGEYDYNCPQPLVKEYCDIIKAPDKQFYLIKGAAHSPLWENEADSYKAMAEIKEKTYIEK